MSSAKDEMLANIRQASGPIPTGRASDYAAIPRDYLVTGRLDAAEKAELFADRLHDYGSGFLSCSEADLPASILDTLRRREKDRLVVPHDLPPNWLPSGLTFIADEGLDHRMLDAIEGVITGCTLAVAATGTIFLQHSAGGGRRAITLIPDYHLCVVFADQLVESVPEAIRRISASAPVPLLTTISGPSATSDIEMTRIKGVHGPRTLDVVFVLG